MGIYALRVFAAHRLEIAPKPNLKHCVSMACLETGFKPLTRGALTSAAEFEAAGMQCCYPYYNTTFSFPLVC